MMGGGCDLHQWPLCQMGVYKLSGPEASKYCVGVLELWVVWDYGFQDSGV